MTYDSIVEALKGIGVIPVGSRSEMGGFLYNKYMKHWSFNEEASYY